MRRNYNVHEVREMHEESATTQLNTATPTKKSLHLLIILQDISSLSKKEGAILCEFDITLFQTLQEDVSAQI